MIAPGLRNSCSEKVTVADQPSAAWPCVTPAADRLVVDVNGRALLVRVMRAGEDT